MKKWLFTIMTSLLLCACTSRTMNIEDARKVVLKDAGVNQNSVSFTKEETINGEHIFEFNDQNKKYSYKVKDGNIISRVYTSIKDSTSSNNTDTNENNEDLNSTDIDDSNKNNVNNQGTITKDEAIDIALKEYNFTRSQVSDIDVEDEDDEGRIIYRVEFYKDSLEYEVEINKQTGNIVNKRVEKDNRKVV